MTLADDFHEHDVKHRDVFFVEPVGHLDELVGEGTDDCPRAGIRRDVDKSRELIKGCNLARASHQSSCAGTASAESMAAKPL